MNDITLPRATVEQALEVINDTVYGAPVFRQEVRDALTALRAALAQQAEPVEPVAWLYTGIKQDGTEHGPHLVWKPEYMDAMSASKGAKATPLYTAPPQQAEPVDTDCHTQGICQRSGYGITQQAEPVEPGAWVGDPSTQDYASTVPDTQIADRLARHGINPCPDCRGLGYDASGQLCWCQQNPSF